MNKKKITALIMSFLLLGSFTFTACKDDDVASSSSSSSNTVSDKEEEKVEFTDYGLVTNGKSDYKIVIPENATSAETLAWQELKTYFFTATGANLTVVTDNTVTWSNDAQYLSVGKTKLLSSASVTLDQKALGENGYMLKTAGKSLFMAGGVEYGTLYAVQRFMHDTVDYEVYAVDETYCRTDVTELKLPQYDISVKPDIGQLMSHYGRILRDSANAHRLGYQEWAELWKGGYVESLDRKIEMWHNSLDFVPVDLYGEHTDWFSAEKDQLCFSNEEMYEEVFFPALKELLLAYPNQKNVTVTQMDSRTWCRCEQCKADNTKYGTDAGNMVKFGNKVARDVREWLEETGSDREVNVVIYAYHNTEAPPAVKNEKGEWEPIDEELKFEENLVLWWVPSSGNFKEPLNVGGNLSYGEQIEAWSCMAHTMYVWSYESRFIEYFVPFNTHNVLQKNMQLFRDYNVQLFFNQADFTITTSTDWGDLSIYLLSKLRWDVDADYEGLIKDFFDHYYQEASEEMYTCFNHIRSFFAYQEESLGMSGNKYQASLTATFWPDHVINGFLDEFDEAFKAIEPLKEKDPERYQALYDRINVETMAYRYITLMLYSSKYSQSELRAMQIAFKNDCEAYQMETRGFVGDFVSLWKQWGI